jgi:hypothetical protein
MTSVSAPVTASSALLARTLGGATLPAASGTFTCPVVPITGRVANERLRLLVVVGPVSEERSLAQAAADIESASSHAARMRRRGRESRDSMIRSPVKVSRSAA